MVSKTGGATVLWDNLDPHITPTQRGDKKWGWTVTLPNIECENCTIQVMQVMEDPVGDAHGPFDGKSDLYYHCVDIKLKKGVGKTPGTVDAPVKNNGINCLESATSSEAADAGAPPSNVEAPSTTSSEPATVADTSAHAENHAEGIDPKATEAATAPVEE